MAVPYPTKIITDYTDWFSYGTDYAPGLGLYMLIGIFIVFFVRMYNGRNFNGAFTGSMWITTLSAFVFFLLGIINEAVLSTSVVFTLVGAILTFLNQRAGS